MNLERINIFTAKKIFKSSNRIAQLHLLNLFLMSFSTLFGSLLLSCAVFHSICSRCLNSCDIVVNYTFLNFQKYFFNTLNFFFLHIILVQSFYIVLKGMILMGIPESFPLLQVKVLTFKLKVMLIVDSMQLLFIRLIKFLSTLLKQLSFSNLSFIKYFFCID